MADYSRSKPFIGSIYPAGAIDAQEFSRVEPLVTPTQLRNRQLLGIPLVSFFPDPITNQRLVIEDEQLADFIDRAVAETELEIGIDIFPIQHSEKHPFDMNFWRAFGYLKVQHRPVTSVEKFAFTPANGTDIFQINEDWIEAANFHKGQINLIPFVPAAGAQFISTGSNGTGSAYLTFLGGMSWIPAIVLVNYTTGFPGGLLPKIINEVVGINAALDLLTLLAATYRVNSYSLGIDGLNQSVSGPGPALYQGRIDFLNEKKGALVRKIKNLFALEVFSDYV